MRTLAANDKRLAGHRKKQFYLPCYTERLGGGERLQDYQIHLEDLRKKASEAALISNGNPS